MNKQAWVLVECLEATLAQLRLNLTEQERKTKEVLEENDKLRGLVAVSDLPCVYCALPSADMGKCASGFPGCGRADDMMLNDDYMNSLCQQEENPQVFEYPF